MSDADQNYIDKINQLTTQPSAPPAPPATMPAKIPTDLAGGATAMANGSQAMLAQAQSGGLTLDPQTGQSLIDTLNKQIDVLGGLTPHLDQITKETKLGMTPGGQAMSKFNQEVAATGNKVFLPAHRQFVQTLTTMVQAVQTAMDNYANTDGQCWQVRREGLTRPVSTLTRRSLILPALVALALSVTACSAGIAGTGQPSPTENTSTGTQATNPGSPLAGLDPCALLAQDDMTALGVTSNGADNTAKSRGCVWQKHGVYTVGIYLDSSQGIDAVGADGATKATLQSHDAVQVMRAGCDIEIAISNTSSVDVNASYGAGQGQECQLAQQYAGLIESKLPAQQK